MKSGIHPEYTEITVTCSCGHSFKTRSTLCSPLAIEVCSKCHPFYTGNLKVVDAGGRVKKFNEKFNQRYAQGAPKAEQQDARE
ncbi:MAG: 50S ribosomal protein L31 [Gammaproteobacteria bacterium]